MESVTVQDDIFNPWKHKRRITLIGCTDICLALLAISYASYRMFSFYWNIQDADVVDFIRDPAHGPFYLFVWVVVLLIYIFQIGSSLILYSAVNQEATETDVFYSIQKCNCWVRCSRFLLGYVVLKLCLQPVLLYLAKFKSVYGISLGIVELIFRTAGIFGVKMFVQELQQ